LGDEVEAREGGRPGRETNCWIVNRLMMVLEITNLWFVRAAETAALVRVAAIIESPERMDPQE
jgi:hypothetical protein